MSPIGEGWGCARRWVQVLLPQWAHCLKELWLQGHLWCGWQHPEMANDFIIKWHAMTSLNRRWQMWYPTELSPDLWIQTAETNANLHHPSFKFPEFKLSCQTTGSTRQFELEEGACIHGAHVKSEHILDALKPCQLGRASLCFHCLRAQTFRHLLGSFIQHPTQSGFLALSTIQRREATTKHHDLYYISARSHSTVQPRHDLNIEFKLNRYKVRGETKPVLVSSRCILQIHLSSITLCECQEVNETSDLLELWPSCLQICSQQTKRGCSLLCPNVSQILLHSCCGLLHVGLAARLITTGGSPVSLGWSRWPRGNVERQRTSPV